MADGAITKGLIITDSPWKLLFKMQVHYRTGIVVVTFVETACSHAQIIRN